MRTKKWLQDNFNWVLSLADWMDKLFKVGRYVGIAITILISISHYVACKRLDKCETVKTK